MGRKGLALVLVGLGAGLASCGEGGPRVGESPTGDFCETALARVDSFMGTFEGLMPAGERYGGTAVVGAVGEMPGGMNAFVTAEATAAQHQLFVNLMTLIQVDENLQPTPYLARSWEVSDDFTELTFHLRDDVFWHDGERTTAYDVEFTYLRVTDPATAFPNAAFWTHYVKGPDGVEVVDSFTVRLHIEQPHAEFLMPWQGVAIMPRHLLQDVPAEEIPDHPFGSTCPVGNGPFRFVSHTTGDRWVFAANPAFPQELGGRPYLDRYVYRVIPEQATLLAELLTGRIDLYVSALPDHMDQIREADDLRAVSFPFRSIFFVGWNARRPQLADARVRRAIALATPRSRILEALHQGMGRLANTGIPPMHFAFDPGLGDSLSFDPERARSLLEEAGWSDRDGDGVRESADGAPLEIGLKYNPNRERQELAEIMQASLAEVGIAATPDPVEFSTLVGQVTDPAQRDFDGVVLSLEIGLRVDETDLFHSSRIDAPLGFAGMQDEVLDRLLDTLPLIPDRDRALPLWSEYQHRILQLQPLTVLYFPNRLAGVNRRLQNVEMDLRGDWVGAGRWWIPRSERDR